MPRPVPGAIFWRYSTYQKFGVSISCSQKLMWKMGKSVGIGSWWSQRHLTLKHFSICVKHLPNCVENWVFFDRNETWKLRHTTNFLESCKQSNTKKCVCMYVLRMLHILCFCQGRSISRAFVINHKSNTNLYMCKLHSSSASIPAFCKLYTQTSVRKWNEITHYPLTHKCYRYW